MPARMPNSTTIKKKIIGYTIHKTNSISVSTVAITAFQFKFFTIIYFFSSSFINFATLT